MGQACKRCTVLRIFTVNGTSPGNRAENLNKKGKL